MYCIIHILLISVLRSVLHIYSAYHQRSILDLLPTFFSDNFPDISSFCNFPLHSWQFHMRASEPTTTCDSLPHAVPCSSSNDDAQFVPLQLISSGPRLPGPASVTMEIGVNLVFWRANVSKLTSPFLRKVHLKQQVCHLIIELFSKNLRLHLLIKPSVQLQKTLVFFHSAFSA